MADDADSGDYYYDFPIRPTRSDSNDGFQTEYQQQRVMLQPGDEGRPARETEPRSVQQETIHVPQESVQQESEQNMGYGRRRHGHRHRHADTSAAPVEGTGGLANTGEQGRGADPLRSGDAQALSSRRRSTDPMLRTGDIQGLGSRRGTDPMLRSVDTAAFSARGGTTDPRTDQQPQGSGADAEPAHQPVHTKADSLASLHDGRVLPPVGRDSDSQFGSLRPVKVRSGSAGQMIPSPDTRPPDSYDRVQPLMNMTAQETMAVPQGASGPSKHTIASRKVFGPSRSLQPPSDYVPPAERLQESRKFGGFSGPSGRTVPLDTIMARRNVFGASKAVVMQPVPRRQPPEDQTRATHWSGASAGSRFGALMAMRHQVLPPIRGDSSSTVGAQSQVVDEEDDYSGR